MDKPLISVAMPIHNAGRHLRMAVLSIVNQSERNWELLILDDGSTDHALDTIVDIRDSRIRIVRHAENKGLAYRLNEAIDLAHGEYFARMDGDDVSYPDRFVKQLNMLKKDGSLDLVATKAIMIDDNSHLLGVFPFAVSHKEICARPWKGFYFPHPAWMGRMEWFRKYRYAVNDAYLCEDQELLLRSYQDSNFATVDEVLFAYRVKSRVDLRKLNKVRTSWLRVQLGIFMKSHHWGYLLLSLAIFFGRVVSDHAKFLLKIVYPVKHSGKSGALERQWNQVLDAVSE